MTASSASLAAYPRCQIAAGGFFETYFGWRVREEWAPRLKLLQKAVGPARKLLLLLDGARQAEVDAIARDHAVFRPGSLLRVHDFADDEGRGCLVDGRTLAPAGAMFGAGTFIFDLKEPESVLFGKIQDRERSKIRKSERAGVYARFSRHPRIDELQRFVEYYGAMARERSLDVVKLRDLERLFRHERAIYGASYDESGAPLTIHITYTQAKHGYFLHGVRAPGGADAAGGFFQWELLKHLKKVGIRWYDFGLVPNVDPSNGLYRFKKSFGGHWLPSGKSYAHAPTWIQKGSELASRTRARIRR